jgi:dTDP-4-dehydrorhamnose 3,5-epimerase
MIEGIKVIPLKQICDDRGKIMHMLKSTDPHFENFGEIYFSFAYPGIIKGWHWHELMTLNYAVPVGMIKLVLYDDRDDSPTKGEINELYIGESNYNLIIVPPKIWNGFMVIGTQTAIVANCATIPHDPDEIKRADPLSDFIPYSWPVKMR